MKHELFTEVKDGVITRNRKAMRDVLKHFEGQSIKITIEKKKKQRSNRQNRYYWGCLVPHWKDLILQEWGELWTKEQTHEFLKMNFGFDEVVDESTGEILRKHKSTTTNSTTEMEEYHEICRRKALEMFNAIIPLPNEELTIEFDS